MNIIWRFCALILIGMLTLFAQQVMGQKINAKYQLPIKKSSSPIIVDGVMDEQGWADAEVATDFFMILPMDTSFSQVRTDVRMTYDDQNLYILVINFHAVPGPYYVESLRRDFSFGKNDNFLLFMDPFDDQTNGFSFGANAAGAQWDGIMYEGGKVDLSWDNKWVSKVQNYDDKWIWEASIPFKSIRYKKGITEWGINFSRLDLKTTEKSSWAPVPRQFPSASLAYTGSLMWDQAPPEAGANISVIPYAMGGSINDFENNADPRYQNRVGVDAKIAVSSSLNLDLTVNPDFSQVEVDRQLTNLDRFELFFPERRQFFLENGDLFANFGYENIRPFFSRRIGLDAPIQFGARLSGKINKDWRIGAMNMQTGAVEETGLPAQNFSVVSLQRRVAQRSNIGVILINKTAFDVASTTEPVQADYTDFNRNLGLEYNLATSNNLWTGKAMVLKSFSPGNQGDGMVHAANLRYSSGSLTAEWRHEYVSTDYTAEVGFVPRVGYYRINPNLAYLFFPKSKKILRHGPVANTSLYYDMDLNQTDNITRFGYTTRFRTQADFTVFGEYNRILLQAPFDPTNFSGNTLDAFTDHSWYNFGAEFISKPQSLFTYAASSQYGGYYAEGQRYNFMGEIGYRFQPYVGLSLSANYNNILLPEPWARTSFWLVGPRADITFTNTVFLTAFVQYNEQINNVNLNTRFQWRFKPASDIFLVFTDNYLPAPFYVKNRSVALKFTYWWTM
ncbi:MAG: carbohydrate binding family 9 domain-containing protein [Lunatimonas sp.]|uniref:DUF5916 domain-containing protein n=1 Tax=Lunatimonas sp. TaxID=2060141 RepID=UPI00263AD15F|nr:DUF5916 domain-containing protein [Lunatimonas sp.]MCC5936654.1 carbohydrate binding family 9 domain-containing protein [Lunatimonas sp.]